MNMTSQTAHTKYKLPPHAIDRNPPMKIFCVRHCRWLQVDSGLQPPTRWDLFVAGTMLRRPEPTKERVEPTILNI